jgi:outer membrane protein assembly factor BamD (BamD/ComL family)
VTFSKILLSVVFLLMIRTTSGQVGVDYDLKKPPKWENRTLASETSNNGKKFRKFRHFVQNNITHYNYYYNSNEKIKLILAKAKSQFKDDYTKLLPFYNFTPEATAAQKKDLDSIVYKCTMGILIHDTRNDWIDNLYLLMGESYFYKKFYDSAYITFQFINWAFAPKEEDGYFIPIGSNYNKDQGGNADKVSTPEKQKTLEKTFDLPAPSRNDALIWKVRTYLAKDLYTDAAALIEVLDRDPQFPARLRPSLAEVRALYYYKQGVYDSTAFFLIQALPAAGTHEEYARWEYLIAQCYERTGDSYEAKTFYERVIKHTYDPVLDIYARLNAIRQNKEGGVDYIDKNIQVLAKMARKDRFEPYRDIIYYTAAQMELERKNRPGAISFLQLCVRNSPINGTQRTKAFLQLANLTFEDKNYRAAKSLYDSVNLIELTAQGGDLSWLIDRKAALASLVTQLHVIDRQDSLQRIAAMPPPQRDAYLKKMVRTLRRLQGLRDEGEDEASLVGGNSQNKNVTDMFSSNSGASSADWYFNNPNLLAKGYTDFKNRWGNRPNVDNWEVSSLMKTNLAANGRNNAGFGADSATRNAAKTGIDYKSLLAGLPLTPEKMKKSNDSIENALFLTGKTYQEGIQDYNYAINSYDTLLAKFPTTGKQEQTLLNLFYCYTKLGDQADADRMLELLKQRFPKGAFTAKALNPDSVAEAENSLKVNATHQYEKIYEAFIEGRFDEALAQKKVADSLYGDRYWTPQLLYIESIYLIRSNQDPQAKAVLQSIINKFPHTPMSDKATTMLDVLSRRRQIEDYLTRLQVTRAKDSDIVAPQIDTAAQGIANRRARLLRNDSNMLKQDSTSDWAKAKAREVALARDTTTAKPIAAPGDKLQVNANNLKGITMDAKELDRLRKQQDSIQKVMVKNAADSQQIALLKGKADSIQAAVNQLKKDTAQLAARLRTMNSVFGLNPDAPHSVAIIMTKVDPVYVNEARNAFDGYNKENFYNKQLTAENSSLNDTVKMLVIGSFPTDQEALTYLNSAKALAPRQIVPWLPAGKYTFLIISGANLQLLLTNKDLNAYYQFLSTAYPGKF